MSVQPDRPVRASMLARVGRRNASPLLEIALDQGFDDGISPVFWIAIVGANIWISAWRGCWAQIPPRRRISTQSIELGMELLPLDGWGEARTTLLQALAGGRIEALGVRTERACGFRSLRKNGST